MHQHDIIIVGAGIVGLAHALAAARKGKRVLVIDRDAQANGASIRNFGFVTVTGQDPDRVWDLAMRSAATWREIAKPAGINIEQEGQYYVAQREEAEVVLSEFLASHMGQNCKLLSTAELADQAPMIQGGRAALWSPHELRVDSPLAIPKLAHWLAQDMGVEFRYGVAVHGIETGKVHSTAGCFEADVVIACPGDDTATIFPGEFAKAGITRCKLQMLRLAAPSWRLRSPLMADLSMVRSGGLMAMPSAKALQDRLNKEESAALALGIHMIAVQGEDGSLIVGDSHEYSPTPDPFFSTAIEDMLLAKFSDILGPAPAVTARWTGTYASAAGHSIVTTPLPDVRLVVITGGTGASTSFALAEDVIAGLF